MPSTPPARSPDCRTSPATTTRFCRARAAAH
jgi:hypothetical protein